MSKLAKESCVAGGLSRKVARATESWAVGKKPSLVERIDRGDGRTEIRFPDDWHQINGHSNIRLSRPPTYKSLL